MTYGTPEERELVKQTKQGCHKAFNALIIEHQGKIESFIEHRYRQLSPEDIKDITQDSLGKAWEKMASFNEDSTFGTWIKAIAKNTALNALKPSVKRGNNSRIHALSSANSSLSEKADLLLFGGHGTDTHNSVYLSPNEDFPIATDTLFHNDPADIIAAQKQIELTQSALASMFPAYREAFEATLEFDDMERKDIADMLGIPLGTFRSRLYRAKEYINEYTESANALPKTPSSDTTTLDL